MAVEPRNTKLTLIHLKTLIKQNIIITNYVYHEGMENIGIARTELVRLVNKESH